MGKGSRNRKAAALTDPRVAAGNAAGPGGPAQYDSVVVDTTRSVLLDGTTGVLVHLERAGVPDGDAAFGLMLEGRINRSQDRSRVLYLADLDGLVAVAAECVALAGRSGVSMDEFMERFGVQLDKNHQEYLDDQS